MTRTLQPPISTVPTPTPSTPDPIERLSARDKTVITVLLVSTFVVVLNETIMSVAIPVLVKDLHITTSTGQWLSTGFALTLAVVIPVTGFLIQRVPTRRLFVLALGLFSIGTLAAALAPGYGVLLTARIVQGAGTAVMIPMLMTTVMTLVPESRRGSIMGVISVVISVAPALGPTISGIVLSLLDWRWIFWVVLPFAVAALIIGSRLIQNVGETRRVPIDLVSIPLAAIGFGGLVYGLNAVGEAASEPAGASSPVSIWLPVGLGVLALTAFVLRQLSLQRTDRALLDLRPFTSRIFTAAVLAGAIAFLALLGSSILLPIYLQTVLHVTPLVTGLLVLPGGAVMGVLGPVVGRGYDRFGPRALLIPGTIVVTGALVVLSFVDDRTPLWYVLAAHIILSIGLAGVLTPLFTAGLGAVPHRFTSHGSAIFATVQQVGGAAGTALFVTLLAVQSRAAAGAGLGTAAASASGVRLAFLVGAAAVAVAILVSCFVAKPASTDGDGTEDASVQPRDAEDRRADDGADDELVAEAGAAAADERDGVAVRV